MVYIRLGVHNSNLQSSAKEVTQNQWCLQAFGDHKDHKPSLYNFLKYKIRNEAQKVCVRKNSVEMNEFESLKPVEIDLDLRALELEN